MSIRTPMSASVNFGLPGFQPGFDALGLDTGIDLHRVPDTKVRQC